MGKVRTRIIGGDIEEKQKKEQKLRSQEKKAQKKDEPKKEAKVQVEVPKQESKEEIVKQVKKASVKKPSSRTRGKKYKKALKLITKEKKYSSSEGLELLKKIKYAGFDEAVELHLNLIKSGIRGEVALPHSIGKTTRAVIATQKVLDDIENGTVNFDVLISEPSFMPKLAKYAKILGPRGLMPSPKTGTISDKPQDVLKKYTGGFIKWRSETEAPLLHQMVGRISHDPKALSENMKTFIAAVGKSNIKAIFIKTTMSPSLQLDLDTV